MDPVAMEKNKEDKKKVVLEHIAAKCKDPSTPFPAMKEIGAALNNGDELKAQILTGGLANFSYMIYTQSQEDSPKLFAKLSFSYAQLFPDKPCPLMRTENEYNMMKIFQGLAPESVVAPYFCLDIKEGQEEMKCLITEWSSSNEQYGNQFIDGAVDPRTAVSLAKSIAALHCSSVVENDFNASIRPFASSLDDILKAVLDGWATADPANSNRVIKLAQEYTKAKTDQIYSNYQQRVQEQEHLIHADFHVFNIMVGEKPAPETLERFPPEGNVVICDWEMSHVGPAGRDLGPFQAFPFSCAIAHAVNGNPHCSKDILTFLDTVWSEYAIQLKEVHGKTDADVRHAYKDSLVFCGLYMCLYSALGFHMNFLPIDETATEDLEKAKESVGVVGLKALMLGCGGPPEENDDSSLLLTLADLQSKVRAVLEDEMALHDTADSRRRSRRNRRSSALRASGVRVSDAHLHLGNLDRSSIVEVNRRSSIIMSLEDLKLLDYDDDDDDDIGEEMADKAENLKVRFDAA
jgi:5-methylthioribose kinase